MVQGPPPPTPPPQPRGDRKPTEPWVYWAIGAGVALVAAIAIFSTGGSKNLDDTAASTAETPPATQEVVVTTSSPTTSSSLGPGEAPGEVGLEPAGLPGPDSFTGEVFSAPVVTTTAPLVTMPSTTTTSSTSTTTSATSETTAPAVLISSISGDSPGLYGGTGDNARCNREAILSFLERNPDKAAAWIAAQNADSTFEWDEGRTSLTTADLRAYFEELTPATLLYDTRVTNNGYRNGRPTPRQSVLQAGTAVLVDKWGVPRSRCGCGNPLTPPRPSPVPPTWVGPPWSGFDPTTIIVVNQSVTVVQQITIININTGDIIIRPVGTTGDQDTTQEPVTVDTTPLTIPGDIVVGSGDLQVTVIWATDADLDLHVVDPTGFELSFTQDVSPSGGQLDVDDVPSAGDLGPHVENIFWPSGGSPGGQYVAFVRHFSGVPSGYTMEVRVGGVLIHTETGSLASNADSTPFEFFVDTTASSLGTSDGEV